MRRHGSGYVEAFFNIRHADVDVEVSGGKTFEYFKLNLEAETRLRVVGVHVTYLRYHIGSASLVIFSFAFIIFFIWKTRRSPSHKDAAETHKHTHTHTRTHTNVHVGWCFTSTLMK